MISIQLFITPFKYIQHISRNTISYIYIYRLTHQQIKHFPCLSEGILCRHQQIHQNRYQPHLSRINIREPNQTHQLIV